MKKINKQSISVDVQVLNLAAGNWKGNFDKLPANKIYELVIDYPLTHPAVYKIKTGKKGLGLVALFGKIGKLYQRTYDKEDATLETEDGGCYGIWGHSIGHLAIEGINVDHKRRLITLNVGS